MILAGFGTKNDCAVESSSNLAERQTFRKMVASYPYELRQGEGKVRHLPNLYLFIFLGKIKIKKILLIIKITSIFFKYPFNSRAITTNTHERFKRRFICSLSHGKRAALTLFYHTYGVTSQNTLYVVAHERETCSVILREELYIYIYMYTYRVFQNRALMRTTAYRRMNRIT
jgi:hypothetical protein